MWINDDDPNALKVTVRVRRGKGFLARFQPPVSKRTVELDEVGSFVLNQVDGKNDTRRIIDAFVERYNVNRREAELSCVSFLKSLATRGVISIVIK